MNSLFIITKNRRQAEGLRATSGIPATHYEVQPQNCKTELGRWLAQNVRTTERGDDGSFLCCYSAQTEYEVAFGKPKHNPRLRDLGREEFIAEMTRIYGADKPATMNYTWGALYAEETPEEFFDRHARNIARIGAVRCRLWNGDEFHVPSAEVPA